MTVALVILGAVGLTVAGLVFAEVKELRDYGYGWGYSFSQIFGGF